MSPGSFCDHTLLRTARRAAFSAIALMTLTALVGLSFIGCSTQPSPAKQPADFQIERINFDDGYMYRLYDQSYDVTFVTGTLRAVRDYYSVRHENDLKWKAPSLKAFIAGVEFYREKAFSVYPHALIRDNLDVLIIPGSASQVFSNGIEGSYSWANTGSELKTIVMNHLDNIKKHPRSVTATFHHEFAHLLTLNYGRSDAIKAEWMTALPEGVDYIENQKVSAGEKPDYVDDRTQLHHRGFVSSYSQTNYKEDMAELHTAAVGFHPAVDDFDSLLEERPLIRRKYELLLELYAELTPPLDRQWFYQQRNSN
jgi:hypothetical protein